jgi:exosortase/archaeosortase
VSGRAGLPRTPGIGGAISVVQRPSFRREAGSQWFGVDFAYLSVGVVTRVRSVVMVIAIATTAIVATSP